VDRRQIRQGIDRERHHHRRAGLDPQKLGLTLPSEPRRQSRRQADVIGDAISIQRRRHRALGSAISRIEAREALD
jgi:hypothetical protein